MRKVLYHSTNKMYKVKNEGVSKKVYFVISIFITLLLLAASTISFMESTSINDKKDTASYSESGKVDYKVYLKDNDFYNASYLESGMQYVTSLVNTINVKFDYQMHATKDIAFKNKYKIVGTLEITERDDPSKILFNQDDILLDLKTMDITDNNFVINEEVDIDYNKYNEIVNNYRKDLGLIVSSHLRVYLDEVTNGTYENDTLNKNNRLEIIIPLSESTLQIKMNKDKIEGSGVIGKGSEEFAITNEPLFIVCIALLVATVLSIILVVYIYAKNFKKDAYKTKVKKILKNYDRLIINGKVDINESNYNKVVIIDDFKEMVDAAQNLNLPILFYETIPNEKCFFVIMADKVLYKYRVTKAYLENDKNEETDKEVVTLSRMQRLKKRPQ